MNHDDIRNVLPFVAPQHDIHDASKRTRENGTVKRHDPSYRRGQSELSKGVSGMSTPGTRVIMPMVDYFRDLPRPEVVPKDYSGTPLFPSFGIIDCTPFTYQIDPPLIWPAIHPTVPPLIPEPSHGYHINAIPRGEFGEASKIVEEVKEFEDAVQQGCTVMALVELADLLGAIEGYLEKHHPTIKMTDLQKMSDITKRVFKNGHRR